MEIVKTDWGTMIVNQDGTKGWGITYSDEHSTSYGWVDLEEATIYGGYLITKGKSPECVTYDSDPDRKELRKGRFVRVEMIVKKNIFL